MVRMSGVGDEHTGQVRSLMFGVIAIPLAFAVGCASSNRPAPVTPSHAGTSNETQAQAEADLLVARVSLPPGSAATKAQPPALAGPVMGRPGVSQLIDTVRYYRIPMSLSQAHDWFVSNPQPGFSQSGSESGTDAGVSNYGWQYDPPGHFSWGTATLQIGVSSEGSAGTGIRVDGLAQWIDPTPVRDVPRGPTIRVTIAGGCPATDRGRTDVSNPNAPDLGHQLLPSAAPTAALECTYYGLNGKTFALSSSRKLDGTRAAVAAEHIRALPLGSRGLGAHSCPNDDGRTAIVVFSYAGRADVGIWENTSGCRSTDNGHIVAGDF
jgi:hypothetical protein